MVGAMLPAVLVMLAVVVALVVLFAIRSRWLARRMDADERARHALALRSQSILTAAGDAIFGVDAAGRVIFANPVALGILGFSSEEFLGSDPSALIREQEPLKRVFSRGEPYAVEGGILTRKDGSTFPADCQINPMREEGATTGAVVVFRDITLRKRAEEEMRYLATYDQLTGLPNRGLLVERIGQAVRLARRRRTRVGVLFVDLDHFKPVNDVLGHPFGDQVLVEVGKRLRGCVRESDTVARHGGDEFVVVLDDLGAAEDAARPAQEIVDAVNACIELGDHRIHVGASVGVAVFPDDGVDATALLAHADLAMYRAKASGRNSFRYYAPEMSDEVGQRREMESALREAVDQGHFELHYQPILGLAGGEPVAAEALVRWRRPGLGLVGPDQFIPLAEETGLISDIGLWVLEEACRQQARWRAAGRSTRLSLNLSSRQVPRGLPLERLSEALARHGLAPADLDIEITESLLVDDSAPVREWLEGLRELGLGLVLDDFGTGYSSLDYLRRIPVTAVKIARGFVATLGVEAGGETLVESILAMAHGLGMRVIAEGVETEEQLAWLRAHGCDEAQGFLLARPAAADAVAWPRLIAGPGRSLPLRVVRGEGRGRPVEEAVEEEAEPTRPAAPSARPG
jgi:diguanylate cyclase (GGDEF)-like protein/PAS domain S-box-containing protein